MKRLVLFPVLTFILSSACNFFFLQAQSYEETTLLEDVIGEYQMNLIQDLVRNNSVRIIEHIGKLFINFSKEFDLEPFRKDMKDNNLYLGETTTQLMNKFQGLQQSIDAIGDDTSKFRTMRSEINAQLSDIKLLLSVQQSQMNSLNIQSRRASNLLLACDCKDLYDLGYNASGTYWLQPYGTNVLCDMETNGGGWMVIQRRAKTDAQVNFNQNWFVYKNGFGSMETEFWVGNDFLHILTNHRIYELLVEMEDYEKGSFYAMYDSFRVGNEPSQYALDMGTFSGNVSDAFRYHHGQKFTTKDRDNDSYEEGNCADHFAGGWWYERCYDAHLNGVYPNPADRKNASYITWWQNETNSSRVPLVLTSVTMKLRPRKE